MPKNIVLCCDGTCNQFGVTNTNVVKLASTLVRDPGAQVVFYDPGVGTIGSQQALTHARKLLERGLGGAVGWGIKDNLTDAYAFLLHHYRPGDRVYIFGFSRGAYTARALAALVHMYGLITPGNLNLLPYMLGMHFQERPGTADDMFHVADEFKSVLGDAIPIHFVGVWDTVASVGWFWDPVSLPYTKSNPSIAHVRHAVAIDERRAFFRQNLFARPVAAHPPSGMPGDLTPQDLKEVWFPGVHADIGGGYAEPESGLGKVTLEWMLVEARRCGLIIDPARAAEVLGGSPPFVPPSHAAVMHDSMKLAWKPLEFIPRRHWTKDGRGEWTRDWKANLFSPRTIPEGATLHQSVLDRKLDAACGYCPPNLPQTYLVEPWQHP